jgi:hypothetical protein
MDDDDPYTIAPVSSGSVGEGSGSLHGQYGEDARFAGEEP